MHRPSIWLLAAAMTLPAAYAQTATATLSGVVTDPTGAAAVNAEVTVTETATGGARALVVDSAGQ